VASWVSITSTAAGSGGAEYGDAYHLLVVAGCLGYISDYTLLKGLGGRYYLKFVLLVNYFLRFSI